MGATLLMVAAIGVAAFGAGPDRIWSNGIVLDADSTSRLLAQQEAASLSTARSSRVYAVQSDRCVYLTEEADNPQFGARLSGNSEVLFAVEGDKLYILGDDVREHETRIIKKVSRSTDPQNNLLPEVSQLASQSPPIDTPAGQRGFQASPRATSSDQQPPQAHIANILPEATPIRMRISRTVSSAEAQIGENVDFETLDDVKLGEYVVIPKGSVAIATVTEAIAKRRMARGGRLSMNIDYVRLASGDRLALRGIQDAKGGGHTGAMTGGMVATAIVFFPAAPFFLFMQGKDVSIPKGHEVTVYTNTDYELPRQKAPIPMASATPQAAPAQRLFSTSALTNADVVKLKAAGLSDQLIIDKIKASPANYRLDVDDLVELKKAGIPDTVTAAMLQASQR